MSDFEQLDSGPALVAARKHPCALCEKCTLRGAENIYVPSTLPETPATLVVVGEAPGYDEAQQRRPFVGQSGKLLRAAINRAGGNHSEVAYLNTVSCRPPNNRTPTPDEVEACRPRLGDDLTKVALKDATLLVLGKTSHDALFGDDGRTMTALRGTWMPQEGMKGALVTWHPAYVLRKPSEMESFLADISRAMNPPDVVGRPEMNIVILDTLEDLTAWTDLMIHVVSPEILCFDIETEQLQWYDKPGKRSDRILMLAIAWSPTEAAIITKHLLYEEPEAREVLNVIFNRFKTVGHNAKFDVVFLKSQIDIEAKADEDTMLMHYTLNELPGTHGLKMLAKTYLGLDDYEEDLVHKYLRSRNDNYGKVPFDKMAEYAAIDVGSTLRLYHIFKKQLMDKGMYEWPYKNLLMRASKCLAEVELNGCYVDVPYLLQWQQELDVEIEKIKAELNKLAGFELNPNSPAQLKKYLYGTLGLPAPAATRKSAEGSTNAEALKALKGRHPAVDLLLKHRRMAKIKSSYVDNLITYADYQNRVHATFLIHGTETGRLSARDPALQTIPRESTDDLGSRIRGCFTAPPGRVLAIADYSQAELRVLAAMSGEPFLLKVYDEGRDLHTEAARALFGENYTKEHRTWCKMLNFAYAYGGNENSFAMSAGMPIEQAKAIVHKYDANMPVARAWKQHMFKTAKEKGYIESPFGRRRRFPVITPLLLDEIRKASVNMPVQSAASDLTLLALCELVERGHKVVLAVHDSIIIECDEADAERVMNEMVEVMRLSGESKMPSVKWKSDGEIKKRWGGKENVMAPLVVENLDALPVDFVEHLEAGNDN